MCARALFRFFCAATAIVIVAAALRAFEIRPGGLYPKIITPNNDGHNDTLFLRVSNPYDNALSVKVYTLAGVEIAALPLDVSEAFYTWDGRDAGGETVTAGVYIVQVIGEGSVYSGVVVVAR